MDKLCPSASHLSDLIVKAKKHNVEGIQGEKKSLLTSEIFKSKIFMLNSSSTLKLLPSTLLSELKKSEDLGSLLRKPRIILTDRILDEAASEVAEDFEWDQLMKEWNTDCEDIPYLITL